MELMFREAVLADLTTFYENCFFQQRTVAAIWETVRHEWKVLLENDAAVSMVVEDAERPAGRRIVGCGQLVFVTDEFVAWMKSLPRPSLNIQVRTRCPTGPVHS